MINKWFACGGAAILLFQLSSGTLLGAEIVELKNGETLRGQLVFVDVRKLTVKSETLGKLSIDREKKSPPSFLSKIDLQPQSPLARDGPQVPKCRIKTNC